MIEQLKKAAIPHLIGILLMLAGWLVSILSVFFKAGFGVMQVRYLDQNMVFTGWSIFGLILILAGAYLPSVVAAIRNRQ